MHARARAGRVSAALIGPLLMMAAAVSAQSLPAPWVDHDIGTPSIAGDATYTSPTFSITAGGVDIWGGSDQFHFVYQPITGDVDVRAHVDDLAPASAWSKAGVMIRASLDPAAAHGYALVSASKGLAFQRRLSSGAISLNTAGEFAAAPRWVRLVRSATLITAYSSADGVSWTKIGSDTVQLGATAYVGIAVTSHNALVATTAKVSQVAVTRIGALPNGQQDSDIGSPTPKGSASYSNGTYTLIAGGTDIWGTSDQFHFVSQRVSGDLDVKARIASVGDAYRWSKGGIMIRQSLDASSAHAFAMASAGEGFAFQRRNYAGDISLNTSGSATAPPGWVRLTRIGNIVTAYQSTDGVNWTKIGSDSVELTDPVYVGIAATSHNTSETTTVIADHFSAQVTSQTNQPPSVTLATGGTSFTAPATIPVAATASDPENQLAQVQFYSGSTLRATDTAAPYSFSWTNVPAGTYRVTAVATDAQGASGTSSPVTVVVSRVTNSNVYLAFTTTSQDESLATGYVVEVLSATANMSTGTPLATQSIGRPALDASGNAQVDITTLYNALPAGTYQMAVRVDSAAGSATSAPLPFTK